MVGRTSVVEIGGIACEGDACKRSGGQKLELHGHEGWTAALPFQLSSSQALRETLDLLYAISSPMDPTDVVRPRI